MEEAEREEQLPVLVLFGAALELRLRDQVVQTLHVGLQSLKNQKHLPVLDFVIIFVHDIHNNCIFKPTFIICLSKYENL